MKWNLRLAAAQRGIWTASELKRLLADRGLVISAGKMSGLWSGNPASIKLSDLDVLCAVLEATPDELLLPDPVPATADRDHTSESAAVGQSSSSRPGGSDAPSVRPRPHGQRSLPPEP